MTRPLYAVIVGVSTYYDVNNRPVYPTVVASDDSRAVAKALQAGCESNDRKANINLVNDHSSSPFRPVRNRILQMLNNANTFNDGDCDLIFFFSGHGSVINSEDVIHPSDFMPELPILTGLTLNQLTQVTLCVKGWRLFVSDTCRTLSLEHTSSDLSDTSLVTNSRTIFIRSCDYGQESIEDPDLNTAGAGVFSYYLIENLQSMGCRDSVQQLFDILRDSVSEHANEKFSVNQTPIILGGDSSLFFPFSS